MGKSCGLHDFYSLGGQYYSLGQSNEHATMTFIQIVALYQLLFFQYKNKYSDTSIKHTDILRVLFEKSV